MKKKKAMTRTPWYGVEEWERVRGLVLERDSLAVERMLVWRCRVSRLPAGVETSLALLQALSTTPHTALSLGTAVNRFLNHVSHLAMNIWGLSKLHEAAERMSVPEWIVQVRHETTHGTMPSLTVLRAALEFGLSWLDTNYWNSSQNLFPEPDTSQEDCEGSLENLLDLYLYLKLYQVWGTERMSSLAGQEEVWSHLSAQWRAATEARPADLHSLTVRQAVGRIKTDICSILDRDHDRIELLADILVREELLVPNRDFLDSLEADESQDEVEVPVQLVEIWSEFLSILEREGGLERLVSRLVERAGGGCHLSAGWVVILAEAMLGHSPHSSLNITPARVSTETLQSWLQCPGPLTVQLCPLLCQLANLSPTKQQAVQSLVSIMALDRPGQVKAGTTVFSLADVVKGGRQESCDKEETDCSEWTLDTENCWDSVSLGLVLGNSDWDSLWVEARWSRAASDSDEEEETVPKFDILPIDWSSAPGVKINKTSNNTAPHFYSNVQEKHARHRDQEGFRRRKRLKKS